MPIETLKNTDGKLCLIKYTTSPVQMAICTLGCASAAIGTFFLLAIVFIKSNATNSPSKIELYLIAFLALIAIIYVILRSHKYVKWLQRKPIYIFEKERFTYQEDGKARLSINGMI